MSFLARKFVVVALLWLCATLVSRGQTHDDPRELPTYRSPSTLTGIVIDGEESPVENARVYLLPNPNGSYRLPVKPLESKSDAEGTFRFEDLPVGGYQLWAETDDATSLVRKLAGQRIEIVESTDTESDDAQGAGAGEPKNNDAAASEGLQVKLHPGCGFDITVHDSEGKPVPEADISFGWTDIDRHYQTDPDGVARIRNLAQDDWFVVARGAGLATEWFKTSKQPLGTILPMEFELPPGGSLNIAVVDEEGRPVPDTAVYVSSTERSMSPNYLASRTDADGMLLAENLPIGKPIRISARKAGYESPLSEATVLDAAETGDFTLVMSKKPYGGDVRIRVVDDKGKPISGAQLLNRGSRSADLRSAITNADGEALLADVQKLFEAVTVVAKAPGFIAQELQVEPGSVEEPGEALFELQPGNTLRGRITNPAGEPMPKLRVYYDRGENGDLKGGRVETDADGRFELTGLGPEVLFTVYTPPEYAPVRQLVLRTDLDELMEVSLVPAGLLLVRAVDADTKQPLPAYNVRIGFCEEMQPGDIRATSVTSSLIEDGINIQGEVREYRLDNQVAGTAYKVIVSAEGYQPTTIARMVTQSAEVAKCVDVPLVKEDMEAFQVVAGRLIDARGEPIVGASVRLLGGREIPVVQPAIPGRRGQKMTGWKYYHWDLLKRDSIENRDQCAQLLRTVSGKNGEFRFEKVRRDLPWLELYYTGEHVFAQRYANLRDRDASELSDLRLQAEAPSELVVTVDLDAYPAAAQLYISADNWIDGPNAVKLPYTYEYRPLAAENRVGNLPAGKYGISLMSKNRPVGNNGFTSDSIKTQVIVLEAGQTLEVKFE